MHEVGKRETGDISRGEQSMEFQNRKTFFRLHYFNSDALIYVKSNMIKYTYFL